MNATPRYQLIRPRLSAGILLVAAAMAAAAATAFSTPPAPENPHATLSAGAHDANPPGPRATPAQAPSAPAVAPAAPTTGRVTRLTPPSRTFDAASAKTGAPIARFLPGQRFDLQATIAPAAGTTIDSAEFLIDGAVVPGDVTLVEATSRGQPEGAVVASLRAFSSDKPGLRSLVVRGKQSDGQTIEGRGDFEIVAIEPGGKKARNVVILIGDGMGISHRTAARIMRCGFSQGKADDRLAIDRMPVTGIVMTPSLNSIVTDSAPGAHCYATGNKADNGEEGVFPDDTVDKFDNPRIESIGEFLHRTEGKSLGIVTTADVTDATPASFGTHTQDRGAGIGIADQFFDDRERTGLAVLLGGGRQWFLPGGQRGSARAGVARNDYELPPAITGPWGIAPGAIDPARNLIDEFTTAGWAYASDAKTLAAADGSVRGLLGLFHFSNMNVALDKIGGRRGSSTVVADAGLPDQPMLDEMAAKALEILSRNEKGFVLMVEGASIDKQAHAMDAERWICDLIEFDRAVALCTEFAGARGDTLVIVTADHECGGVAVIGASRVTDAKLAELAAAGGGAETLRDKVVGAGESAGFPRYRIAADGYPETTDIDYRMLIGYAAGADRFEDWRTNPKPAEPAKRDTAGGYRIPGIGTGRSASHTAADVGLSAAGVGARLFTGVMDNTDVFFKIMQVTLGGVPKRDDE